ncbi:MAG TPA: hypothetical protein VGE30_01430 [Candidatus Saccharimonadales bacterium]
MPTIARSPELDIQAVVGEIIAPYTPPEEAREVFTDLVEQLELPESDRFRYVRESFVHGEHILPLIKDPHDAVVTEMVSLRDLSDARTVHTHHGLQHADTFITHSAQAPGVDAVYRIIERPTGARPLMTIETKLQDQLEDAAIFRITQGSLRIVERRWRRGAWHEIQRPIHEESRGEKLLLGLVSSTLYAGHLALTRTPTERQAVDADARRLAMFL